MDLEQELDAPKAHGVTRLAVIVAVVAVLAFVGGFLVGAENPKLAGGVPFLGDGLDPTPDPTADLDDFWKAWNVLEERFVETNASSTLPGNEEKVWGAIEGLAESFDDPYTVFLRPADAKIFAEDIAGNFSGVGMEIGLNKDRILTVIAPLKGTPAERAGIHSGDLILAIDGVSTDGLSTDEAVKKIRGEKGTTVTFRLARDGEPFETSVVRDTIEVPTIDYGLHESGVYVISLYSFTANSPQLMNRALADFRGSGSRMLLLDLRGNPGGYLEAAVRIAGHFLPEGTIVVTEDYRGNEENIVHRTMSAAGGVPEGTKVAVLIDQGSASASEILAGALQDEGVATIIGTKSFGKGSVQELVKIGGGSLKITVARWLTPSGRSISDGGLTPDILVERTPEDITNGMDPQKERAIQFLTTGN